MFGQKNSNDPVSFTVTFLESTKRSPLFKSRFAPKIHRSSKYSDHGNIKLYSNLSLDAEQKK